MISGNIPRPLVCTHPHLSDQFIIRPRSIFLNMFQRVPHTYNNIASLRRIESYSSARPCSEQVRALCGFGSVLDRHESFPTHLHTVLSLQSIPSYLHFARTQRGKEQSFRNSEDFVACLSLVERGHMTLAFSRRSLCSSERFRSP